MALSASSELPIIDFSKEAMKPGTETWDLTRQHVRKALEEYGSFVATFNEINRELYTDIFSSLEKLFDLPKDTKRRFTSDAPFSGFSEIPQNPLYEAMGVDDALTSQTFENLSLLMWPQGDATFCETLLSYSMRLSKLEQTVRNMIFQSYGVESRFEKESKSILYNVRFTKYGAPMTDEDTEGGGVHFDKSLVSILQADRAGLQVQTKDGAWIDVMPSGSSLIVMMGESFFGWSNGRLRCCPHRVRMSGFKSRYSIGLFSTIDGTVDIPSELVDEKHPLLFKPFDYDSLLKFYAQQRMDRACTNDQDNIVPSVTTFFSI